MIKEQAEMLQEDFENVCGENDIKAAFGFFIDGADNAMLSFHKIKDDDLIHFFV